MKEYYSYEQFKEDTHTLLDRVKEFHPEGIVAVARGGMTLAHALAQGLDLRDVQSLRTELYDSQNKRDKIELFGSCSFGAKRRVLVVDDIADSGETLICVMEYLEKNFKDIEFKVATLFYKKTSLYQPHYSINEAKAWIDFFWEADF